MNKTMKTLMLYLSFILLVTNVNSMWNFNKSLIAVKESKQSSSSKNIISESLNQPTLETAKATNVNNKLNVPTQKVSEVESAKITSVSDKFNTLNVKSDFPIEKKTDEKPNQIFDTAKSTSVTDKVSSQKLDKIMEEESIENKLQPRLLSLKTKPKVQTEEESLVYVKYGENSDVKRFTLKEFIHEQSKIDSDEKELLQSPESYCKFRKEQLRMNDTEFNDFKEMCKWEYITITTIKSLYGNTIKIVKQRSPYALEFDFLKPNEKASPKFTIFLENLEGIAEKPYTYEDYINVTDTQEKALLDKQIKQFIANIHKVPERYIKITAITEGCIKVDYQKQQPAGQESVDELRRDRVDSTDEIESSSENTSAVGIDSAAYALILKKENFEKMEIHDAFFIDEFDVELFDKRGHKHFAHETIESWNDIGGRTYITPQKGGWVRMGIKVLGLYDNGDDTWLDPFGHKSNWVRGYHGMGHSAEDNLRLSQKIIESGGLRIGRVNAFGPGVYWSDNPEMRGYDGVGMGGDGKEYYVKLMCAINPEGYSHDCSDYFHCPKKEDIRIYGIIIRPKN